MEIRKIYSEFNTPVYLSKALNLYYGGWEICCPMHTFGPAIRQHYLIHYVTRGKGRLWMNDTCYVIEKDTMFLIRPGITCVYQADKDDPWEYCWICIDGYDVENMLNNSGFDKVNPLFLLESLLYSFFSILSKDIKTILPTNDNNNLYVKKAIEFIENNYTNNLKITDIAKYVCITRNYLYLLFRKHLNISPQEYLANYRITRAEQLLNTTTLSIETISNSCGYQDPLVFAKAFKAKKGFTPSQYRKSFSPKISFNKPVNRMK